MNTLCTIDSKSGVYSFKVNSFMKSCILITMDLMFVHVALGLIRWSAPGSL